MSFPEIGKYPYISVDVETTGLKWWEDEIFGIAVSTPDGQDYYWDIREGPNAVEWLKFELPHCRRVVNHNIKFDMHFLRQLGIHLPSNIWCTQIAACLINEHERSFSLDNLSQKYTDARKGTEIYGELANLFGGLASKNVQMKNIWRAPASLVGPYAKKDTAAALKLYEWQREAIKRQGLEQVLDLEMRLFPVVMDMETRGVRVDVAKAEQAARKLGTDIKRKQQELNRIAGFEINPNSSTHMHDLFLPTKDETGQWITNDGAFLTKTATGKPSFNADNMKGIKHPAARLIINIKKLQRCKNTFLEGHILGHHSDGIVHPSINQTKWDDGGTGTGRLSYMRPALQQMPSRDKEIAVIVRPIFIPDAGQIWGCWDWSQFEFRMAVHYMNNDKINKIFHDDPDTDFHQMVADMTGLPRTARHAGDPNAKEINLGMIFGMGAGKLAERMGLPYTVKEIDFGEGMKEIKMAGPEAQKVMDNYHSKVPDLARLKKKGEAIALTRGYVKTIMERHVHFPGGKHTHKAAGHVYQGSSADCMKQKLVEVFNRVDGTDARILLSVHDEINLSMPENDTKLVKDVTEILTTFDGIKCPIKLRIPITSDYGKGENWLVASGK